MDVYVQDKYLDQLSTKPNDLGIHLHTDLNAKASFEAAVFDVKHLTSEQASKFKFKYLIADDSIFSIDLVQKFTPTKIFCVNEISLISQDIQYRQANLKKVSLKSSYANSEVQIENLQQELFEKSESLKYFINEENVKKNKEKKLLYFLDFLNAEHDKLDFIDNLCQLLWTDLKKIGSFYTLGFVISMPQGDNTLIFYDGKQIKFIYNADFDVNDEKTSSTSLANILQRPLAMTRFWSSQKNNLKSYFFLENKTSLVSVENLDSYLSERIDLTTLMIQRHISQLQASYLLNKWNIFGRAYQNPMHVIDADFNLIQTNYLTSPEQSKCYEKLADRKTPCENCPLAKNGSSGFVTIKQHKYKAYSTKFQIDKNYYFIFYDDQTEVDLLKSNMIQNEKMNVIGQLANHLAHELNNPLTGLKLATEFILQQHQYQTGPAESSIKSDFTEVLKGIDRCKNIITDLLDFSSNQNPTLVLSTMDEVIKKTMPLLKSITRNHNIFVDVKNVPVKINSGHLQQVIFNLIKNSCQAIPSKGSIKIYDIDHPNQYDVIFEDNGMGLPDVIKNNLFQPFATTKEIGEGTGLGLYISKSLMKRMGADLIYDSNYKSGTRFVLRFQK